MFGCGGQTKLTVLLEFWLSQIDWTRRWLIQGIEAWTLDSFSMH